MPTYLANLDHLKEVAKAVAERVTEQRAAWVVGASGTGRSTLARDLLEPLPNAHVVTIPPGDEDGVAADAVAHTLVRLAEPLHQERRRTAFNDALPAAERLHQICTGLAELNRVLVLHVPGPLTFGQPGEEAPLRDHLIGLLRSLIENPAVPYVLITDSRLSPSTLPWNQEKNAHFRLTDVTVNLDALDAEDLWGSVVDDARRVKRICEEIDFKRSPIVVRLAVAVAALGGTNDEICGSLQAEAPLNALVRRLIAILSDRPGGLTPAVRKLSLSRYPIRHNDLGGVIRDLDDFQLDVLTQCIGYGSHVRISEPVRTLILHELIKTRQTDAHLDFAAFHHAHDGVQRPEETRGDAVLHWLEALHHAGNAGERGHADWTNWADWESLPREFIWDHARSLSKDYRKYDLAARLFEICARRDENDSYSWHYFGYNLHRSHERPREAEDAYRKAIALDPDNPWWNTRLVTFLISRARFEAAKQEWTRALERVDFTSASGERRTFLVKHMHRWVAESWLQHARPFEAEAILEQADRADFTRTPLLAQIYHKVQDAIEVETVGAAIYPPNYPIPLRWKVPASLPSTLDGARLWHWYPARVIDAAAERVRIVYATTKEGEGAEEARTLKREVPADEWETASDIPAPEASGFYFIGIYEGGGQVIRSAEDDFGPAGDRPILASYWDYWI